MSSRLRSLDSKISFFAFADIITAVSGVLIFIALLLATDLGRPTNSRTKAGNSALEQKLQETLAQQLEVDAQNHRLQELLASVETAPNLEKLKSDMANLRSQLAEAQKKQAFLASQIADSQTTIAARDKLLGLTELNASLQRTIQDAESVTRQETTARSGMNNLEQQIARQQSRLLQLRQREGQLWLIPDQSATTKEPILVIVSGAGVTIERFDHPEQRKQLGPLDVDATFQAYLREAKSRDQYLVFLVRPSGIEMFQGLVKSARDMGFEVGFDALEEDRQIHFTPPPALDESNPPPQNVVGSNTRTEAPANAAPAAPPTPNPPPPTPPGGSPHPENKSWWQRLLEWAGLRIG